LRYNANAYWNKVKAGIERNGEAIRIIRLERRRLAIELLPPPGSPPFAYRAAYEAAGWRPIAPHERQTDRMWGIGQHWPADIEKECSSPRDGPDLCDYAREIRNLELQSIRHRLRLQRRDGVWREGLPNQLSHEDWQVGGNLPGRSAYSTELPRLLDDGDALLLRRVLAKSPGRPPGRPPIGNRRMTDAERQRRRRARWQSPKPASAVSPQTNSLAPRSRSGRQLFNQRTDTK
jgi:hypothetical protein